MRIEAGYEHSYPCSSITELLQVIKLEVENKHIPVLKKRLDQLETEIRLQSIVSPDESGHYFSNLLSSSVPVSHLGSSQLSDGELSPAMLLVEVYRMLNCDGAVSPLSFLQLGVPRLLE